MGNLTNSSGEQEGWKQASNLQLAWVMTRRRLCVFAEWTQVVGCSRTLVLHGVQNLT